MNILTMILAAGCLYLAAQLLTTKNSLRKARALGDLASRHHRSRAGSTSQWRGAPGVDTPYDLRSFDSGANWVEVERHGDGSMRIIGDAEQIHPGLANHLQSIDALCDAALAGPVDLGDTTRAEQLAMAGFDLTTAKAA